MKAAVDSWPVAFFKHTFTPDERNDAHSITNPAEFFATRFAAKEAVFKAIAHLIPTKTFDFRIVETRNLPDGCPYITTESLRPILKAADVRTLHISITTEGDCATAFVIAEK